MPGERIPGNIFEPFIGCHQLVMQESGYAGHPQKLSEGGDNPRFLGISDGDFLEKPILNLCKAWFSIYSKLHDHDTNNKAITWLSSHPSH